MDRTVGNRDESFFWHDIRRKQTPDSISHVCPYTWSATNKVIQRAGNKDTFIVNEMIMKMYIVKYDGVFLVRNCNQGQLAVGNCDDTIGQSVGDFCFVHLC